MKKTVSYKYLKFEVDFARTKEIYQKVEMGRAENCGCDNCKNFSTNRENIYPIEIKKLLEELGIDYKKEVELGHYCKLENGKHLYDGFFHVKGKILDGNDYKTNFPNEGSNWNAIPIDEDFQIAFKKDLSSSFFDKEDKKELIRITFLVNSDWVIDKELETE